MVQKVIVLTTGTSTWTVPDDWNNNNNRIICLAGGGMGGNGAPSAGSAGAGSGGLSYSNNVSLTKAASINVGIAATVTGPRSNGGAGVVGNNTWFGGTNYSTATIRAEGGQVQGNGFVGGRIAQGVGDVKRAGGNGSGPSGGTAGGGGGAPSDTADGGAGSPGVGGLAALFSIITNPGGVTYSSGNGGISTGALTPGPGQNYGGGGSGGTSGDGIPGNGAQGFIAIIYTPLEAAGYGFIL